MRASEDRLAYLAIGSFAAIALGVALIPLRGATSASNLAFVFLALTIVVGHAGGRGPAVATALTSALSLNFFLTRPYLTLVIHGKDDVLAFLGLAGCGLISATLGARQAVGLTKERELAVLHAALARLQLPAGESRLQAILDAAHAAFPLAAIVLHDEAGRVLAFAGDRTRTDLAPQVAEGPAPGADEWEALGPRLARDGLRLPLVVGRQPVGRVDLWGDGRVAGTETMRTLRAVVQAIAALVVTAGTRPSPESSGREPSPWLTGPRSGR